MKVSARTSFLEEERSATALSTSCWMLVCPAFTKRLLGRGGDISTSEELIVSSKGMVAVSVPMPLPRGGLPPLIGEAVSGCGSEWEDDGGRLRSIWE